MTAFDSRAEYERRMHKVAEHIDRHLDQPLTLNALAVVAHFSALHFHRLFAAWMGETLGNYLSRRRLETAAMRLASQPHVPVLHIALAVGFGSGEAFARAFKLRFGCSPTAWRTQRRASRSKHSQAIRKLDQAPVFALLNNEASRNLNMEVPMNVKLVDRLPANIAYMRHTGPYGAPVNAFWIHRVVPWLTMNNLMDQPRYGIGQDDPAVTAPEKCRYDACVEVPPQFVPGAGVYLTTIPGGRYAAHSFKGTVPQVGEAWTSVLRDWLPASGYQLDGRPCFEYFPRGSSYDPATGIFDCQICIPVSPL